MPKVPDYGPAPSAPMAEPPKPEFLMMAAAVMHEQGKLFEEQPQAPASDVTKLLDQQIEFHKKQGLPTDKLEQQKLDWNKRMKQ